MNNFNLGKGSWTEKKARLDKFIKKLQDNEKLKQDFIKAAPPKVNTAIVQNTEKMFKFPFDNLQKKRI